MAFWDFFTRGSKPPVDDTQAVYDAASRVFAVAGPSTPPRQELRDIPVVDILQWNVNTIRAAVSAHVGGQFGNGALLTDAMLADDRIQGATNGRTKGVTRAAVVVAPNPKAKNQALAKQVATEIEETWDDLFPESVLEDILKWQIFQGFSLNELVWNVRDDKYVPQVKAWHPLYSYFNISDRKYYAFTQDGVIEVKPNDPKWALYTPYGYYRGWMRGAVRSVSIPWLVRQFALRDWARYSEVHGLPQKKAKVPAQAPAEDKRRFFNAVKRLGSESAFLLPMPATGVGEWDVDLLEARDTAWKGFDGLIERCDKSITLTIRGTNLTTQVQTGTGAATEAHREEDSDYAEADGKKLAQFLRKQVLMFYCLYNYGDADLAPLVSFETVEEEDKKKDADTMSVVATALTAFDALGWELDPKAIADKFLDGIKVKVKSPEEKLKAAQDMMMATTPPDNKDESKEDAKAHLDVTFLAATEHDEKGRFTGPGQRGDHWDRVSGSPKGKQHFAKALESPSVAHIVALHPVTVTIDKKAPVGHGKYLQGREVSGRKFLPSITVNESSKPYQGTLGHSMRKDVHTTTSTLVHELGHHFHDSTVGEDSAYSHQAFSAAKAANKFVSEYARTNAQEYFAENYVASHLLSDSEHKQRDPHGYDLIKNVHTVYGINSPKKLGK